MPLNLITHDLFEDVIELTEMTEDDVTALVPGEPSWVNLASGKTAGGAARLEELIFGVAELIESARSTEAGWSRTEDDDAIAHLAARFIASLIV
jgi:hypothetical protein